MILGYAPEVFRKVFVVQFRRRLLGSASSHTANLLGSVFEIFFAEMVKRSGGSTFELRVYPAVGRMKSLSKAQSVV